MSRSSWLRRAGGAAAGAGVLLALAVVPAAMAGKAVPHASPRAGELARAHNATAKDAGQGDENEVLARAAMESYIRTAPGSAVPAQAYAAAMAAASHLQTSGGSWQQLTDRPFLNDPVPGYHDPVWSDFGSGYGLVTGRMTALTAAGGAIFAGAADGGVWKSTDGGGNWTSWSAGLPRLSIGALATNPADGSVWVGLGEANTAFENFNGFGIYRLAAGAHVWQRIGGSALDSRNVYYIHFDGAGHVYAATNSGLFRHSASPGGPWHLVLKPDPNPTGSPYRTSQITDVTFQPGTGGRVVLAALGWRGGTLPSDLEYNGFYVSQHWGKRGTFHRITPKGDIDVNDIGRTSFSAGKGVIYAIIESPKRLINPTAAEGFTNLQGIYVSKSGNPAGPWTLIADATKLAHSGSAEPALGQFPGAQTWYNQYIQVDPNNPMHVYAGLEEVYQSFNGGQTWSTIAPYFNSVLPCFHGSPTDCPPTAHSDQHAVLIAGNTMYTGSDGGVWRRPLSDRDQAGWIDLNATLRTTQYYSAGIGRMGDGDAVWGGLQDNGATLTRPDAPLVTQGFTGDGGDVIVDPANANHVVNEYVDLDMALSTDAGKNYREISPSCGAFTYTPKPCDPAPQFIAPFTADVRNPTHWVAGGEFIWNDHAGWNTHCSATACDWKIVHDTHASTTALAVNGKTIYAGWCALPCEPHQGVPFQSGIDTNAGGTWHTVHAPNLPNRFITGLAVDRNDPNHVAVTFGGFLRRWIPGGGNGHVFESWNGGKTWKNMTGNLPDNPAEDVVLVHHKLIVATDLGVFVARDGSSHWARLGHGLPNVATWSLGVSPSRRYVVAATHGRGQWKIGIR
jgi:hypothetical protein